MQRCTSRATKSSSVGGWGHVVCGDGTGSWLFLVPISISCAFFPTCISSPWISQCPPINSLPIYIDWSWFLLSATNDHIEQQMLAFLNKKFKFYIFMALAEYFMNYWRLFVLLKSTLGKKINMKSCVLLFLTIKSQIPSHEATIKNSFLYCLSLAKIQTWYYSHNVIFSVSFYFMAIFTVYVTQENVWL